MIINGNSLNRLDSLRIGVNNVNKNNKQVISLVENINSNKDRIDEDMKKRMEMLSLDLRKSIDLENNIQEAMNYLSEKEKFTKEVLDKFNNILSMSNEYNGKYLSEDNRNKLLDDASEELKGIGDYLKLVSNNYVDEKHDILSLSSGEKIKINSNKVNINFSFDKNKDDEKLIKIDLNSRNSIESLLQNKKSISEDIIAPLKNSLDEIVKDKKEVFEIYNREKNTKISIIDELKQYEEMVDSYFKSLSKYINSNIKDIDFQSSILKGNRVQALIW